MKLHYFNRLTPERVDKENGIIYGVSVITGGVKAKGHPLICDTQTVEQAFSACDSKSKIKTKANHRSGVKEVNGFLQDFRVIECPTGEKVVADWHLLKKDPSYEHTLEIAERMPGTVGLSLSFTSPKGKEKGEDTKYGKAARVAEVLSCDFVTDPAANPDGLFEVKEEGTVDTEEKDMAKTTEQLLEEILKNQTELAAQVAEVREFNDNLVAEREAYEAAQEEAEEEPEAEEQEEEEEQVRGEEDPRDVLLARAMERIEQLEARAEGEDEEAEAEVSAQAFGMLKEKMTLLAAQRDEALAELESFRTPRVSASTEGVRMFSRGVAGQTAFQEFVATAKERGQKPTEAITQFIAEQPDLYKEHLESREAVASM